jgi:hypothetical protein
MRRHPISDCRRSPAGSDLPLHDVPPGERCSGRSLGDVRGTASHVYQQHASDVPVLVRSAARVLRQLYPDQFSRRVHSGLIDIAIGSLDQPAAITPSLHYWDSKRLPWVQFSDELPRYPEVPPVE